MTAVDYKWKKPYAAPLGWLLALLVCLGGVCVPAATAADAEGSAAGEDPTEYKLDKAHSRIGFRVGHLGISTVSGHLTNYSGRITLRGADLATLETDVTIQVKSVDTGNAARDKHLRAEDFFDSEEFPEIRFVADTMVREAGQWKLLGDFTMHGVTRQLTLPLDVKGPIEDPWGNTRIGLTTTTTINRHDYGVGSDKISDKMVGEEVTLDISVEATAKK